MDRDPLQAAITGALGAGLSFVVAFLAVQFVGLFTDDPEMKLLVAIVSWAVAFAGFLMATKDAYR